MRTNYIQLAEYKNGRYWKEWGKTCIPSEEILYEGSNFAPFGEEQEALSQSLRYFPLGWRISLRRLDGE